MQSHDAAAEEGAMKRSAHARVTSLLWILALALVGVALARTSAVEWSYLPTSPAPRVEDRRAHRFRDFTYGQSERLLRQLLRQAQAAPTPRERALALARVATLQRERGFRESARAAGEEALQLAGNDAQMRAEVRSILSQRLRLEDVVRPRRDANP